MHLLPTLSLDHCVVHVSDSDVSDAFYRTVLGAEILGTGTARRAYRFGSQQLNVHLPGAEIPKSRLAKIPVPPGGSDLCFEWPGPIEDAISHLAHCEVTVETGPHNTFGARGKGRSVYFRDPDGSLLEFISYYQPASRVPAKEGVGGLGKPRDL